MIRHDLDDIEHNLDVPRGTLRAWLSEQALRPTERGATESRHVPRFGGWRALLDLF